MKNKVMDMLEELGFSLTNLVRDQIDKVEIKVPIATYYVIYKELENSMYFSIAPPDSPNGIKIATIDGILFKITIKEDE